MLLQGPSSHHVESFEEVLELLVFFLDGLALLLDRLELFHNHLIIFPGHQEFHFCLLSSSKNGMNCFVHNFLIALHLLVLALDLLELPPHSDRSLLGVTQAVPDFDELGRTQLQLEVQLEIQLVDGGLELVCFDELGSGSHMRPWEDLRALVVELMA